MKTNFTFSDLVLLVGTNPLPNYVVANYFIRYNQNLERIWLIYSTTEGGRGTQEYASDTKDVLVELLKNQNKNIKIREGCLADISRAKNIVIEVRNIFGRNDLNIEEIHLNYTGGTKAMSVHIYRELENIAAGKGKKFSASYLDARDFKLKLDEESGLTSEDLRKSIEISWEHLFKLHSHKEFPYRTEGKQKKEHYISGLNKNEKDCLFQKIAALARENRLTDLKAFSKITKKSKDDAIELLNLPNKNAIKEYKTLIDNRLKDYKIETHRSLLQLLAIMPNDGPLATNDGKWIYDNFLVSNKRSDYNNQLIFFLDGGWLEGYLEWIIKINKPKLDPLANFESQTIGKGSYKFEIDLLVKDGYQLCGISCTTALDYGTAKTKGFEIILRTRQLGGDEALAILVTLLDKKGKDSIANLENDLRASTGASQNNFIVLGINDLHPDRLWTRIRTHLQGA